MPRFKDSEFAFSVVEPGDYTLTVFEFSTDLSAGAATNGSDRFNIVFNIEGTSSKMRESLIDHEKTDWKIDLFLKACGIRDLPKNQDFHFEKAEADRLGWPWINPMGLRCRVKLKKETYKSQKSGKDVEKNAIETWYTDMEPLRPDPELRTKLTEVAAQKLKDENTPF